MAYNYKAVTYEVLRTFCGSEEEPASSSSPASAWALGEVSSPKEPAPPRWRDGRGGIGDPEASLTEPAFEKAKTILVYCGSGMRTALAGKTLREFGYHTVYNAGGFKELADQGLATEPAG